MCTAENAIQKAVRIAGGQSKLARLCRTSQPRIWQCLNRNQRVPADLVLSIENATGGIVTRSELRPDLYPEASPTLNQMMPQISPADQSGNPSVDPSSTAQASP